MSVTVLGLPQLLARLTRAQVVAEASETAVEAVASLEVEQVAQVLAPVDTGALRDSIGITDEGVEATADYALYVEFGTSETPAQPFLRPAMDEVSEPPLAVAAAAVIRRI